MQSNTVLLLEDDPVIALDLRLELERQGCRVLAADDVPAALQLCERYLPSLALLNFALKPTDGMALARLLRTCYLTKVLFITGARPQDVEASADFYAGHDVLQKPFTRRQLRNCIRTSQRP